MGTYPSAPNAVERGSPGSGGDSQAAPAYGNERVMTRGATGRKGLTNGGSNEEEDEDLEVGRRALVSGVQRWCLDVSEWGELSTDQASERNAEAGGQIYKAETAREGDGAERLTVWAGQVRQQKRQGESPKPHLCGSPAVKAPKVCRLV